eukprot:gene4906-15178_t
MSHDAIFHRKHCQSPRRQNSPHSARKQLLESGADQGLGASEGDASLYNSVPGKSGANYEDWYKIPGIQEKYDDLIIERDLVLSIIDDTFYLAYGHFLRHNPGPYLFEIDSKVAALIGQESVQALMTAMRIAHPPPEQDTMGFQEDLCYWIDDDNDQHGPISKMAEDGRKFIST